MGRKQIMPRLQHQREQVFCNATTTHEQLFKEGVRGMLVAEANAMNAVQAGRRSYRLAAMKPQSQLILKLRNLAVKAVHCSNQQTTVGREVRTALPNSTATADFAELRPDRVQQSLLLQA